MINTTPVKVIEPSPNNDEVVLSVEGVSKKFCRDLKRSLFYGVQDIAGELTGVRQKSDRLRSKEFWALNNVSFQLRKGEALGLVGKNGSGKSTLLRIIAGLIKPDLGTVKVTGRVAPLIALGAGFNPVLTGRENIYANMSILGLSTKEIDERFDEVVDFAEIGEAIDAPVQSYSSGMAARLGFASAIHTEPDILLIDEVLAVGDSKFRAKCFRKLHKLRQNNTSFILVSHDAHSILTVCESSIYLNKGQALSFGETALIMKQYEEELFVIDSQKQSNTISSMIKPQLETTELEITSVFFRDVKDNIIESPTSGEPISICIECKAHQKTDNVSFSLFIKGLAEGEQIILLMSSYSDKQNLSFSPGTHELKVKLPYLGLRLGAYNLDIYVKKNALYHLDAVEFFSFKVNAKESISRGLFYQPRTWELKNKCNNS